MLGNMSKLTKIGLGVFVLGCVGGTHFASAEDTHENEPEVVPVVVNKSADFRQFGNELQNLEDDINSNEQEG